METPKKTMDFIDEIVKEILTRIEPPARGEYLRELIKRITDHMTKEAHDQNERFEGMKRNIEDLPKF